MHARSSSIIPFQHDRKFEGTTELSLLAQPIAALVKPAVVLLYDGDAGFTPTDADTSKYLYSAEKSTG